MTINEELEQIYRSKPEDEEEITSQRQTLLQKYQELVTEIQKQEQQEKHLLKQVKKQIQIQSPAKGKKVKPAANKSFGGRCGGSESMKQITKPAHIPLYERAQQQLTRKYRGPSLFACQLAHVVDLCVPADWCVHVRARGLVHAYVCVPADWCVHVCARGLVGSGRAIAVGIAVVRLSAFGPAACAACLLVYLWSHNWLPNL